MATGVSNIKWLETELGTMSIEEFSDSRIEICVNGKSIYKDPVVLSESDLATFTHTRQDGKVSTITLKNSTAISKNNYSKAAKAIKAFMALTKGV